MSKKKTYRVLSRDLDLVLFVKGFSLGEEKKLYNSLRGKILKEVKPIKIEEYKNFIVKKFLVDVDSFFEMLPDNHDDMVEAVDSAYEAIIGLYRFGSEGTYTMDFDTALLRNPNGNDGLLLATTTTTASTEIDCIGHNILVSQ